MREGLGETLYSPLAGTVDGEARHTPLTPDGRDLLDQPTRRAILLPHDLERLAGNIEEPEEVDLHLGAKLTVSQGLKRPAKAISGVVDHNVDTLELGQRLVERSIYGLLLGDVQVDGQEILGGDVVELQLGGVSRSGDSDVTFCEDLLDQFITKSGGGAGHEKYTRHDVLCCVAKDVRTCSADGCAGQRRRVEVISTAYLY